MFSAQIIFYSCANTVAPFENSVTTVSILQLMHSQQLSTTLGLHKLNSRVNSTIKLLTKMSSTEFMNVLPSPNNSEHVQQIKQERNLLSISISISHMQTKRNLLLLFSSSTHTHLSHNWCRKEKGNEVVYTQVSMTLGIHILEKQYTFKIFSVIVCLCDQHITCSQNC